MENNKPSHGGNRRQIMAKNNLSELVDFSANLNPLGAPTQVIDILKNNLNLIEEYPDEYPVQMEKKIAGQLGISQENIIVSNGSIELFYLLPHFLRTKLAAIITPTFSEYEYACLAAKCETLFWPSSALEDFNCDWGKFFKKHGKQIGALFLANPNNPTGKLIPKDELLRLVKTAKEYNFLLIVDEAFIEFVEDYHPYSLINEAVNASHLVVIRSLTKFYAIPGLRLGYGIGKSSLIEKLKSRQFPWNINSLAQSIGEILLDQKDYQEETCSLIKQEREILYQFFIEHPFFIPFPSAANYLLVNITKPGLSANNLQERLINKGYLIRNCTNFRGLNNSYFRIAVRTPAENQGLMAALKDLENESS